MSDWAQLEENQTRKRTPVFVLLTQTFEQLLWPQSIFVHSIKLEINTTTTKSYWNSNDFSSYIRITMSLESQFGFEGTLKIITFPATGRDSF